MSKKKSGCCCNMEIVEVTKENCDCSCADGDCSIAKENKPNTEDTMSIKILGSGCKNCVTLAKNTESAISQMNLQANIEKVTDLSAIAGYGVMSTPALVIDEKVVSSGKVLKPEDVVKILKEVVSGNF